MNKTVLITGASSGIGAGCAYKFASQGARLILNARSTDKLESLAQELKDKYNAECFVMPFDVCNRNAASAALEALPDEWKSIDILINNAGLAIGTDREHEGNIEEIKSGQTMYTRGSSLLPVMTLRKSHTLLHRRRNICRLQKFSSCRQTRPQEQSYQRNNSGSPIC